MKSYKLIAALLLIPTLVLAGFSAAVLAMPKQTALGSCCRTGYCSSSAGRGPRFAHGKRNAVRFSRYFRANLCQRRSLGR